MKAGALTSAVFRRVLTQQTSVARFRFAARLQSETLIQLTTQAPVPLDDPLARVVDLLPGIVSGPWDRVQVWLSDRLNDVWHARGPYPGMGPMLAAAGMDRGALLAHSVLDALPEGEADPWQELERAVAENRGGLVGRTSRKAFELLLADEARYRQLRIMSRFALTSGQARELFATLSPSEVIENPYCLFEFRPEEPLAFSTIDRGLWPQDAEALRALSADPSDEPVSEASDDRRVRAASLHVLERAAEQGHTLLDEAGLRKRLAQLEIEPKCDPVDAAFEIAAREFEPLIQKRELARGAGRGWQMDRLAAVSDLIRARTSCDVSKARPSRSPGTGPIASPRSCLPSTNRTQPNLRRERRRRRHLK